MSASNKHHSRLGHATTLLSALMKSHSRVSAHACMQAPDNPQPPLALVSGPVKLGASCAGGAALGITFDGRASPPSANRQLASCVPIPSAGTQVSAAT